MTTATFQRSGNHAYRERRGDHGPLVLGADDYIGKLFNTLELLARIRAKLRRAKSIF